MTPEEWERCDDPDSLLVYLGPNADPRKLRFVACAWVRRGSGRRQQAVN
jgi:hypothetical protein